MLNATACPDEMESPLRRHVRACGGHPRLSCGTSATKTWMAASSPAMTLEKWFNTTGTRFKMGKRLLLFGLLVMSGLSTQEARAQAVVFLKCIFFNGRVERIKIDPIAKKAGFLNGGTFALEVSEGFYTLTTEVDFGASGGGVADVETKINRRSQLLTTKIGGGKSGYFTQYPLGGTCSGDEPWPGTVF
jgi:hypothetical protein